VELMETVHASLLHLGTAGASLLLLEVELMETVDLGHSTQETWCSIASIIGSGINGNKSRRF